MAIKLLFVGFLLAHAAVHLMFFVPKPAATPGAPTWPFELGRSWALSPLGAGSDTLRILGIALVAVLIGAYALAALASFGIGPSGLWVPAVAAGTLASLALLALFYLPWLTIGVGIDLVMLWLVLVTSWSPEGLAR
ncbi:MAG TPA: hypothetical protein VIH00_06560 [Candidatus Limnocylindrales bacterium]|nr:MAG: hypothetical protein A2V84_14565 [Chloroflexi bacterium RBG_16_70_13]